MKKIIVSQDELSFALKSIGGVAVAGNKGRNSHPVLKNVLVKGSIGIASITAVSVSRSFSESLTITIPSQSEGEFEALLNYETLQDVVNAQRGGQVVEVADMGDDGDSRVRVNSAFITKGVVDDYPVFHQDKGERSKYFSILSGDLHRGATHTTFAASADPSRGVITGVFLEFLSESSRMTATDGNCLISLTVGPPVDSQVPFEENSSFILPVPVLAGVSSVIGLSNANPVVTLSVFSKGALQFDYGAGNCKFKYLFNGVPGEYPKYLSLFPQSFLKTFTAPQSELLGIVSRASRVVKEGNRVLKLRFDSEASEILFTGHGLEESHFNESLRPLKLDAQSGDHIAFNCTYLYNILKLKALKGQPIVLEFNSSTSPAVIRADGDCSLRAIVMPIQLRSF